MSIASTPAVTLGTSFARQLPELAVPWQGEEVPDARLLVLNEALAAEVGLDPQWLRGPDGLRLLTGTGTPAGATPVAQGYAGHQFGGYSPRLGDGRALLLGELSAADGTLRDLHLKGSGRTPFARGGDGRAVVGPMLREYVVSEAMHALGIPTTRSLAVTGTGRTVQRETGRPGAVLARIAASHLRVGSFQYVRATGDTDLLRRLADHALARHHPAATSYPALFAAVVAAQAALVARWMLVGFVHGVMNTDNMTISGETIDYGPCAFLEAYDPGTVYSSIDHGGRYAYGNQPAIAEWNLARLAEAMLPLLHDDEDEAVALAVASLGEFREQYHGHWSTGMAAKLGLPASAAGELVNDLLPLLRERKIDFTSFFRTLPRAAAHGDRELDDWVARWRAQGPDVAAMDRVNPAYIPRNHLVEEALAAAEDGDLGPFTELMAVLARPYDERPGLERYAAPAPADFGTYQTFCGT
ncbi:YdiU family protein [Actinoplanes sp. NPDC051859]|uniref:YdiU family protein n=1 Tax=Actinoplanes sp. NPDC051859 TaxID=3363909 RepID=UPI0037A9B569